MAQPLDLGLIFKEAIHQTRMGMCFTDPRQDDNPIVFCNEAFRELTGYAEDEIIGQNCRFLQGKDTDSKAVERIRRALRERTNTRVNLLNYRKDGTAFWNALHVSPIFDDAGELLYFFGSQWDATEETKTSDALVIERRDLETRVGERTGELRAANDELRLLLTAIGAARDAVLVTEAGPLEEPGPEIVYVSRGFERMTGYTKDEVIGRTPRLLQGESTDRASLDRVRAALKAGEEVDATTVNYKKDGTPFWIEWSIVPVRDAAGALTHWVAVQRDVSERIEAEVRLNDRLRQQALLAEFAQAALDDVGGETLLQRATEVAAEGLKCGLAKYLIPERDADGRIVSLRVMAGVGWKEGTIGTEVEADTGTVVGYAVQTGEATMSDDLREDDRFRRHETLAEHGVLSAINVPILASGEATGVLEADSRSAKHFDEDDFAYMRALASILASALERRQTVREREFVMAELDHRVKNMLARIQSIAQRSDGPNVSKQVFRQAFAARLTAMGQAHELLTHSRWRGADLRGLFAQELRPYARGDKLRLVGPEIMLTPKAALAVNLVVHELATNAAKYGALNVAEGEVEVRWERVPPEGRLSLTWQESKGPRVKPPERRGFGSTVIERALAFETGGQADLTFAPGGLRLEMTLPPSSLVEDGAKANRRPADTATSAAATKKTKKAGRVLIVEDDFMIATTFEEALQEGNWQTLGPVGTVGGALALIANARIPPDAAILDIDLGGETSFAVADALHERDVPYAFISGYASSLPIPPEHLDAPRLRKPLSAVALRKVVRELSREGEA